MGRTQEQLGTSVARTPEELLGDLEHPGGPVRLEPFPYAFGSPATGGLYRLRAEAGPGSARCSSTCATGRAWILPPECGARFVEQFPWRSELELWDEPVLAAARRDAATGPPRHRRAGRRPGRGLDGGRRRRGRVAATSPSTPGRPTCSAAGTPAAPTPTSSPPTATRRASHCGCTPAGGRGARPAARSRTTGSGPSLARRPRRRPRRPAPARTDIPEMLDRLDTYVQTIPHGDASPQNLLVPADDPETFVAIDVSFRTPHAAGLRPRTAARGLVHAGEVPAAHAAGHRRPDPRGVPRRAWPPRA